MPDCLYVLLDRLFKLFVFVQPVSVVLRYLCYDVCWEFCVVSNILRIDIQTFLKQVMNFYVVFHFVQFAQEELVFGSRSKIINCVFLYIDLKDAGVLRCVPSYSVLQIKYLKLTLSFLSIVNYTWPFGLEFYRHDMISEVLDKLFLILFDMVYWGFLIIKLKKSQSMLLFLSVFSTYISNKCICGVVEINTLRLEGQACRS